MHTYGLPGGLWLAYQLDLDRGEYVVVNEAGDEVASFPWETDAQVYCAANTAEEDED